jgi:hypothetical protein
MEKGEIGDVLKFIKSHRTKDFSASSEERNEGKMEYCDYQYNFKFKADRGK